MGDFGTVPAIQVTERLGGGGPGDLVVVPARRNTSRAAECRAALEFRLGSGSIVAGPRTMGRSGWAIAGAMSSISLFSARNMDWKSHTASPQSRSLAGQRLRSAHSCNRFAL